jgi:hypothetical protein
MGTDLTTTLMLPPDMQGEVELYHNMYRLRGPGFNFIARLPSRAVVRVLYPIYDKEKGGLYQMTIHIEGRA